MHARTIGSLILGLLLAATLTAAETYTWTGTVDADWFNPGNWEDADELPGVPDEGDSAVITAGSVLLTNETAGLAAFTMTGGTLTFSNWTTRLIAADVDLQGGTLTLPPTFAENQMSNRIHIVCTDMTLAQGGIIEVSSSGFAAANGLGKGSTGGFGSGGGGYGGQGSRAFAPDTMGGAPYGSPDAPIEPGSGGGNSGASGGAGGGAVHISAGGTVRINGSIRANGGNSKSGQYYGGGGSGGAIFIECATFAGSSAGLLSVNGGGGPPSSAAWSAAGGGGRIAVKYQNLEAGTAVRFSASRSIVGWEGNDPDHRWRYGSRNGTVYLSDTGLLSPNLTDQLFTNVRLIIPDFIAWTVDSLSIGNCSVTFEQSGFHLTVKDDLVIGANGSLGLGVEKHATASNFVLTVGGNLVLTDGATLYAISGPTNAVGPDYGALATIAGNIVIGSGSWIYPVSEVTNGGSVLFRSRDVAIAANGGFNANGKGFGSHAGPGKGTTAGGIGDSGGGYGGKGGDGNNAGAVWYAGGASYGSSIAPADAGSGGGHPVYGGPGGGLVRIEADGEAIINGTLTANGGRPWQTQYFGGGGAGGGIFIQCDAFAGGASAVLRAIGGKAYQYTGGGGGGRIAVWYKVPEPTRSKLLAGQEVRSVVVSNAYTKYLGAPPSVAGGTGGWTPPDARYHGALGSIVFLTDTAPKGTLIIIR